LSFGTRRAAAEPDAIAPDGSEVRLLCGLPRGSMASFTLPAGVVSRAVVHRTIEELWFIVSGRGRMWRRFEGREEVTELEPGISLSLPVGTAFQFRADGAGPLTAIGVSMPPWPGDGEAIPVAGVWPADR
jgi:mannose-6-phosphate isomerase-like protein (cupin superfamily)